MSLLDRGRQRVVLELAQPAEDAYGATSVTYGPKLTLRANVFPLTAREAYEIGVRVDTSYKIIRRQWPGGSHSRVTWAGRKWFQRGEALMHVTGRSTKHQVAIIVAADAKVV